MSKVRTNVVPNIGDVIIVSRVKLTVIRIDKTEYGTFIHLERPDSTTTCYGLSIYNSFL